MSAFRNFLNERANPIPVGKYDNDVKVNTEHFVDKIERRNVKPRIIEINPDVMVSAGVLFATQHKIDNRVGFDDPVLPDYDDLPVLINFTDNNTYILDGHHRMAKAYTQKSKIKVYLFDLD